MFSLYIGRFGKVLTFDLPQSAPVVLLAFKLKIIKIILERILFK